MIPRRYPLTLHEASKEKSSTSERGHGRKRVRTRRGPGGATSNQPAPLPLNSQVEQGVPETTAPIPMSFESRIALALQGSNWQELQKSIATPQAQAPGPETVAPESTVVVEDDINKPPEMTAKQKKKRQQFDRTIARDTGDVLQIIDAKSVTPVASSVTWDQDPELLCSYNWQASDESNTIFGESILLWLHHLMLLVMIKA
jgi:hypothetical protein